MYIQHHISNMEMYPEGIPCPPHPTPCGAARRGAGEGGAFIAIAMGLLWNTVSTVCQATLWYVQYSQYVQYSSHSIYSTYCTVSACTVCTVCIVQCVQYVQYVCIYVCIYVRIYVPT